MKIVFVNTFGFLFGGAEKYFFDTAQLLESRGHKVSLFCMQHPKNIVHKDSKYFVSYFPPFESLNFLKKMQYAVRFFYNVEARKKFRKLIREEKPDIVHINIISYEITHAIILEAKKQGLPVAMTLHDHRLVCPQVVLLNKGNICEQCLGGSFFSCIKNKCIFNSRFKSILMALFYYFNYFVLRSVDKVDFFISPSEYLKNKIQQSKYGSRFPIVVIPHLVDGDKYRPDYNSTERSIVYFGRLAEEKGLEVLVDAVKDLDITLKIIGLGFEEYEQKLKEKVSKEKILNVKFLGYREGESLFQEVRSSMFSVIPSLCVENAPLSIMESFALGKPVVASAIGGIPEFVKDNITGFLFRTGDRDDLKAKIKSLIEQPDLVKEMGRSARVLLEGQCDPEKIYQSLYKVYNQMRSQ